jgi:hypothetical protein
MRLIERCIERDLNGELELVFERQGLYCRASIPLARKGEVAEFAGLELVRGTTN